MGNGNDNTLGKMERGFRGLISAFEDTLNAADKEMTDRLRELGFAEGLPIELLHHSPFGKDPIAVRVDGMTIALRRKQANLIVVQPE